MGGWFVGFKTVKLVSVRIQEEATLLQKRGKLIARLLCARGPRLSKRAQINC